MNLTVSIYIINPEGQSELAGQIRWDGKAMTASDPDRLLLKNIMTTPLRWPGLTKPIMPEEGEKFVRNLYMAYRSPYCQALKATID